MKNKKSWQVFFKKVRWVIAPFLLSSCEKLEVLNSHGTVGQQESFLIKLSLALMLIVVIPVFIMVFWFAVRYRASNKKATYKPKWGHSNLIEALVWGVPILIIIILSYLTWTKTIELDPYKPLKSEKKPIQVEVISTDWNWLFIYPDYNIAVVNQLVFPEKTPVKFRLTSASVMSSFFIPQLGSQIYAMAGMQTKLNLMANQTNVYTGQNQEYSGNGYARMRFKAISTTREEFDEWVKKAQSAPMALTKAQFDSLKIPHTNNPVTLYSSVATGLFDQVKGEFMDWMNNSEKHKLHMKMDSMPSYQKHKEMEMMHQESAVDTFKMEEK